MIGLLFASRAVTVIVLVAVPATMLAGDAETSDCAAETAPVTTVTVAVGVMPTPPIVAETVFASATVEAIVPVVTPLALVTAAGGVMVFPVPVEARATVAPLITLLFASRAVTVIVLVATPATIDVGEAAMSDCAAETTPGTTVTAAVAVIATLLIVTDTVFRAATVDAIVPVATPLAFVTAKGCVSVFPLPVALSATAAPGIGLPFASRAVTVIVLVAAPATMLAGEAVTVERPTDTAPAVTATTASSVIAIKFAVAVIVFASATVDARVPVATPLALVTAAGGVSVFPVPVATSATVAPWIGLLFSSRTVTEIVVVAEPATMEAGAASTIDCAAEIAPATTVTVAVGVMANPPMVAETVLACATVEAIVPVATPPAFVTPTGCVIVLSVPVDASRTVAPAMGLPFASRAVTVIVLVAVPATILAGAAVTVESVAETVPAKTLTVAVGVMATLLIVAETVFDPAIVDAMAPVTMPLAFVTPTGCVTVFPVPDAASTTVAPGITLLFTSRAVTVMMLVGPPAEIEVGDALTVDVPAATAPGPTVTVAVPVIATPAAVAEIDFDSATVDPNAPVATPTASVTAAGCVIELPVPLAAITTVAPGTTLLNASRAVTATTAAAPPAVSVVGEASTVELAAETAAGFTVTVAVGVIATTPIVAETIFA